MGSVVDNDVEHFVLEHWSGGVEREIVGKFNLRHQFPRFSTASHSTINSFQFDDPHHVIRAH
jgi:hypothetical protein